jgi:N-acetylmuramoyl-L-alanine amidase
MSTLKGKVSWFGGPDDTGVSPSEGLAFIYEVEDCPQLFLDKQPPGTTGLARRLDPEQFYIACRWNYDTHPKTTLCGMVVKVRANDREIEAWCADWGPHVDTGRVADISPGLMQALGIETDDEVEVIIPDKQEVSMTYERIVISSGHGKYVRGASGILDEVDEARKVVDALAEALAARGVDVVTFHDDTSKDQSTNLSTITAAHNKHERDLDVSVHFNAYEQVSKPMGVEVLYITQQALAAEVSAAIASCGFINRGAKKRSDLYFLNNTEEPAILLEVCFVDSEADADIYEDQFGQIIDAIAVVLGGEMDGEVIDPPTEELPPPSISVPTINIEVAGEVNIYVNGDLIHGAKS